MNDDQRRKLATITDGDWFTMLSALDPDEIDIVRDPNGGNGCLVVARFGTINVTAVTDGDKDSQVASHDHDGDEHEAHLCHVWKVDQGRRAALASSTVGAAMREAQKIMSGDLDTPTIIIPEPGDPRWSAGYGQA